MSEKKVLKNLIHKEGWPQVQSNTNAFDEESMFFLECKYNYYKNFGAEASEMIEILEKLNEIEYKEKYALELAQMYYKRGNLDASKSQYRKIINYFRGGEIVHQARQLMKDMSDKKALLYDSKEDKIEQNLTTVTIEKKLDAGLPQIEVLLPPEINKEFDRFIGMESVKKHIVSFMNETKLDQERENAGAGIKVTRGYHFMILGNPGTGKTEVARILANLLFMLGKRKSNKLVEVDRSGLVAEYIGHTERKTREVIQKAQGGTLFIDEAYTLYKKENDRDFGKETLDVLMKAMEDQRDSFSVILAGYKKQMYEMFDRNPGFRSRINLIIEIQDYTNEELLLIGDKIAEGMGLVITRDGKQGLLSRINKAKVDETFGNARFIRDTLIEAYRNLANRLAAAEHTFEDMFKLRAVDFGVSLEAVPEQRIEATLSEMNALIGLTTVKHHVESIVNSKKIQVEMVKRGLRTEEESVGNMHMIFRGRPGTGKTTIARLIGKIYGELGLLKRGEVFVECSRTDLVSGYVGQTAIKTKEIIKKALGGILFIDEAYSLIQGENDSFGKEAIDTLIADMENYRDRFMVILCGYKSDMDKLIKVNSGLSSRVSEIIDFDDYSSDELIEIFKNMMKYKGMYFNDNVLEKAKAIIEIGIEDEYFGNARGVRNMLEHAIRNQNSRLIKEQQKGKVLLDQDFLVLEMNDLEI